MRLAISHPRTPASLTRPGDLHASCRPFAIQSMSTWDARRAPIPLLPCLAEVTSANVRQCLLSFSNNCSCQLCSAGDRR
jgi:hypothetical protein